jgi:hypothetical protein
MRTKYSYVLYAGHIPRTATVHGMQFMSVIRKEFTFSEHELEKCR